MQDFRTRRNLEEDDRDVGGFPAPTIIKQSVLLIQSLVEKRRNGFTGYRQYIRVKRHAIPNECIFYFVNNNTLLHNIQFVKCHLFTANGACFS